VPHCPGDTIIRRIESETIYDSFEVFTWAESDFLVAVVGGEEERRDVDYSEKKGLGEVTEVGASESGGT
jgi:hypothetical protein